MDWRDRILLATIVSCGVCELMIYMVLVFDPMFHQPVPPVSQLIGWGAIVATGYVIHDGSRTLWG